MKRARNGTGCVYGRKRKDGSVGWWVKVYRNGEQIIRNAETTDKAEALEVLQRLLGEKAAGKPIARRQLTLQGAVDHVNRIATNKGKRENPVYEKHLVPWFKGHTKTSSITSIEIERYKEHRLASGAAHATINRELEALRRAYTLAMQHGLISSRPHIERFEENNTRTGFFEREDFKALRLHLPNKRKRPLTPEELDADPYAGIATFGYITGWRRGEVFGLRWKNVDFEAGTVRLEPGTTKNKDGRTFYMTAELRRLLERRLAVSQTPRKRSKVVAIKKHDPEGLVFTKKNGAPIVSFNKRWWSACRAAGIPDRVSRLELPDGRVIETVHPGRIFHDFRRTAVRNLERAGVPRSVAMKMVGHKTESIYRRYAIVSESDLAAASRRLEQLR